MRGEGPLALCTGQPCLTAREALGLNRIGNRLDTSAFHAESAHSLGDAKDARQMRCSRGAKSWPRELIFFTNPQSRVLRPIGCSRKSAVLPKTV